MRMPRFIFNVEIRSYFPSHEAHILYELGNETKVVTANNGKKYAITRDNDRWGNSIIRLKLAKN